MKSALATRPIWNGTPSCLAISVLCAITGVFAENSAQTNPHEEPNPYSYGTAEYRAFAESQRTQGGILETYREISTRFNRELAGRYPFGPLDAPDVYPRTVCDFFRIHEGRFESTRRGLDSMQTYRSQVAFLAELAAAGGFLAETACSRFNQPIRVNFRPADTARLTSDPPRVWKLTDDFGEARFPHGIPHIYWRFRSPIALEVTWAEHTELRPRRATAEDEFETPDTATVRFAREGYWALMRFIDTHAQESRGFSRDTAGVVLGFTAPLIPRLESAASPPGRSLRKNHHESQARLTIHLTFENYEAGGPRKHLKWPAPFPAVAPLAPAADW